MDNFASEASGRDGIGYDHDGHSNGNKTMSAHELDLLRMLNAKTREIESVVAKAYGIGDDLDASARRQLEDEIEALIEEHEDFYIRATPSKNGAQSISGLPKRT